MTGGTYIVCAVSFKLLAIAGYFMHGGIIVHADSNSPTCERGRWR